MSASQPSTPSTATPEQRRVMEAIASGPRGDIRGPFKALLRSPELADRVQRVGEYIRFQSVLPRRLNELAILVTARKWTAQFEWYAHHKMALEAGLDHGRVSVAASLGITARAPWIRFLRK